MLEMKRFTVESANRTLPLVRKIVDDILQCGQNLRARSVEVEKPEEDPQIHTLMDHLEDLMNELEALGCSYKDWNFSLGLVDFPAVLDGQDVFLCWRNDEPEILFYHDLESGFTGRKPIPK